MELIRKILFAVEQHQHGRAPGELRIDGYSAEQIGYHCYLLGDAGLADVSNIETMHDAGPMARVTRLTWAGHEFLDAAKDDTTWERAKQRLASAGKSLHTVTLGVLQAVLVDIAKQQLGIP
jgi:hypothetical protein